MAAPEPPPTAFWDYVHQQGGRWMWKHVEGDHADMKWVATALHYNTLVMVTDGSYNKTLAPKISGAGWMITFTTSQKMLGGWFYEASAKAGSYRGELLGTVTIHLLTAFAAEFYIIPTCRGQVHCDNKGALHQALKRLQRVRTGAKHSDLLRSLRSIKANQPMEYSYTHVRAHQDDHLTWRSLSLIEQLNVICDSLAGQAGTIGAIEHALDPDRSFLLPREKAAVIFHG